MKIILASKSPRRKALLEQIGLEFEVISLDTPEIETINDPRELVLINAELKADAVFADCNIASPIKHCQKVCEDFCRSARKRRRRVPNGTLGGVDEAMRQKDRKYLARFSRGSNTLCKQALIIGADTTVVLDGKILGKPVDADDAFSMLKSLSGRTHTVYTGVCLIKHPRKKTFAERAEVTMREISDEEIRAYIKSGEPADKAGAYGLQGFGAVFVERIAGDYSAVIGLPLCALWREMRDLN